MPLGRAFTMRSRRAEQVPPVPRLPKQANQSPALPTSHPSSLARSDTQGPKKLVISNPINLVSSTNMLTFNAPDLPAARQISSPTDEPRSSSDESDSSVLSNRSRETLTDASSVDGSPVNTQLRDELNDFFKIPSPSTSVKKMRRISSVPDMANRTDSIVDRPVPLVPQRKPSHSKQAHQQLARQRSMQHMRNTSSSSASTGLTRGLSMASRMSREQRESLDFFKGTMDPSHPFNNELQELHEVAEELTTTVRDVEMCDDQLKMREQGLAQFNVDDYLVEIQPLYVELFGQRMPEPVLWI